MPDHTSTLRTAKAMAQTLVDRDTDINELAKVATHLRTHLDGAQFFRLLETMVKDGHHLVRSGRTLDYYRSIQDVCRQHLGAYRDAKGEQAQELAEILGWAVRLMRYHKGVGTSPTARPTAQAPQSLTPPSAASQEAPRRDVRKAPAPQPAVVSQEKEVTAREIVTLVEDAKNRKAPVETKDGERVVCSEFPVYPGAKKGMRCRADVTRRGSQALRAMFKRWE